VRVLPRVGYHPCEDLLGAGADCLGGRPPGPYGDRGMRDVEKRNLSQIEALNQRGGRTLSLVDLMEAGTISSSVVGFMLCSMAQGASVLMGAELSGAGKSTLLANALGLLPPGERLVTTSSDSVIEGAVARPPAVPECYLAHEIGSGHWYGYIWGVLVRDFFRLMDTGRRIAACLHADTLAQTEAVLKGAPLFVDDQLIARLGLVGFVHLVEGSPPRRRLTNLYSHAPGVGLLTAFRWRESDDTHDMVSPVDAFGLDTRRFHRACGFAEELLEDQVRSFEEVRQRVVDFYQREGW